MSYEKNKISWAEFCERNIVEEIHSEIISKISDMLPCNPNLHQSVSKEILETLHKYLD